MRKKTRDQDGIFERRDSPYWWASTPDGRGGSTRRSTGVRRDADPAGTQAQALRAAWLAAGQGRELTRIPCQLPTFDDLLLAYLTTVTPTKRAHRRDRTIARTMQPHFTGRTLASLTGADVRGYIALRQQAGIAPATINREITLLVSATKWAAKALDWDLPNPWAGRHLQEPDGRERHLTRDEADALLAAADRRTRWPWLADFIRLCLATGLRPGEATGLEWERVDLGRRLIRFSARDQKSGRGGTIPINDTARTVLVTRARFRATHCPDSPWVFCRQDGSRVQYLKNGFRACATEAGIADLHPHDLRRTFGSWLVQAGVGIERVSKLLRHADVSVTARVYAHLRASDLAEAAAVLDRPRGEDSREDSRGRETG